MTKREHEIEYLLIARGLELFVLNLQNKVAALQGEFFRPMPQQPRLVGAASAGQRPPKPIPDKKRAGSFGDFFEAFGIIGTIVLVVASALWVKTLTNPILLEWANPLLLILGLAAICLIGFLVFSDEHNHLIGVPMGIAAALAILALFGLRTPFLIGLPLCCIISVAIGFAKVSKKNKEIKKIYDNEMACYRSILSNWEKQNAEVVKNQSDYQRQLSQYERDVEQWRGDRDIWESDKNNRVSECGKILSEAQLRLNELYNSEKIVPLPYRYAEAVCYLYDFLSTSSDDYDIKYALERADQAEIKRLMGTIIQNQSQQILLSTIHTMELAQLHNDNIGLQSAIYESGERIAGSVQDMGRGLSSDISNIGRTVSEGMRSMSNAVQESGKRDTALLKDIAGNANATAGAAAYLAAKQNTGVFPAQWQAQQFLIHSKKYL